MIKLQKNNKLPMDVIKFIVAEIILGLEYMHKHNICHRDLKPDNILFDANFRVKICDFGEAKMFKELDREQIIKDFNNFVKTKKRDLTYMDLSDDEESLEDLEFN